MSQLGWVNPWVGRSVPGSTLSSLWRHIETITPVTSHLTTLRWTLGAIYSTSASNDARQPSLEMYRLPTLWNIAVSVTTVFKKTFSIHYKWIREHVNLFSASKAGSAPFNRLLWHTDVAFYTIQMLTLFDDDINYYSKNTISWHSVMCG